MRSLGKVGLAASVHWSGLHLISQGHRRSFRHKVDEETSVSPPLITALPVATAKPLLGSLTEELSMLNTELGFQKRSNPELPPDETKQEWLPFKAERPVSPGLLFFLLPLPSRKFLSCEIQTPQAGGAVLFDSST